MCSNAFSFFTVLIILTHVAIISFSSLSQNSYLVRMLFDILVSYEEMRIIIYSYAIDTFLEALP